MGSGVLPLDARAAKTVDCFAPGGDLILAAQPLGIVNESAP